MHMHSDLSYAAAPPQLTFALPLVQELASHRMHRQSSKEHIHSPLKLTTRFQEAIPSAFSSTILLASLSLTQASRFRVECPTQIHLASINPSTATVPATLHLR